MGACDDDDVVFADGQNIAVAMPVAAESGSTYATLNTHFDLRDNTRYTNAGYCYSLKHNPDIYGNVVVGTIKDNVITATLTDLAPETTYYIRAFVSEYQGGVVYSKEFELYTSEGTLEEQLAHYIAPTYVDEYSSISGWDQRSQWNLANVHDPTVMKADDGYYYMYTTDASYGNAHEAGGHFHGRRSKDLVNWEYLGGTMTEAPSWVAAKVNEIRKAAGLAEISIPSTILGYWAPVARNLGNGKYRMYYSIVIDAHIDGDNSWTEHSVIGMMETTDPASNKWEDKGYVICAASDKGKNWNVSVTDYANAYYRWNAIDPSYIITPEGKHYLIYGSWYSGIVGLEVNAETGMPVNTLGNPWGNSVADIANYGTCIYTRQMNNRWQGSEGPEIIYHDGYYYLFLAYDELSVAYNTRVVRSKSILGPYVGIDGTDCTNVGGQAFPIVTHPYKFANNPGWVGYSHCAVFEDGNGNWYYASQARLPENAYGNAYANAIMMGHVSAIRWTKDGWPVVMPERYAAVPKVAITEDELVGTWEHIDLGYSYGQMKESSTMVLSPDHTITEGTWEGGTWSYDAENQILTANGVDLYLSRECDWEASPRVATIVYSGINKTKTYWGKKSK